MDLVVLSVAIIALLVAVLALYLFTTGLILKRIADNLDDCLQSVQTITMHAAPIGPGVARLNQIGGELLGALPLLYEGAERLLGTSTAPADAPPGVGYMDAPEPVLAVPAPAGDPVGVCYLDT